MQDEWSYVQTVSSLALPNLEVYPGRPGLLHRWENSNAVPGVRLVPLQPMKAGQRGGFRVFDPQSKTLAAMDHVDVQIADGHARIILVTVRVRMQLARLRGFAVD